MLTRKLATLIAIALAALMLLASACDGDSEEAPPEPTSTPTEAQPEPTPSPTEAQPEPTPTPTEAPGAGKIAFHSNRDDNWEVYVMNADGSGPTNLTENPAEDFDDWPGEP